jgi:hypothetical protein
MSKRSGCWRSSSVISGLRACWATQALPVCCAGDELDPAALQRDEEEHVDPFQPGGLDGEELTGERRRRLLAQEASPGELVSLRRRRQAVSDERMQATIEPLPARAAGADTSSAA